MQAQNEDMQAASGIDGGAAGSGLPDQLTHDPTQGKGTDAWQQALKAQAEFNARERRN